MKQSIETMTVKSEDIERVIVRLNGERRKILDVEVSGDTYLLRLNKPRRKQALNQQQSTGAKT